MKKLVAALLVVVVVAVGVAIWAFAPNDGRDASSAGSADASKNADSETAAAEAAKVGRPRTKTREQQAPQTLAVAGFVRDDADKPVAGASVEVFALPTSDDVPDEERVGKALLTKMFGKSAGDRLWSKSKGMREAAAGGDMTKMMDQSPDTMAEGFDLMSDDGAMDALSSIMGVAREALLADDGPWTRVGAASSGPDGAFRVEGLSPGRLELRAKSPGHVKAKQRANAGDATVSIKLARGVRIAGTVTSDKSPLVGATCVIKGATTTTGAGGRFEFDAAHAPNETLIVSAPNCVAQGRVLTLSLDFPPRDLAIDLEPAGSIAGHVLSATGGAVVGARVVVAGSGNALMDLMSLGMGMMGGGKFEVPPVPGVSDATGAFQVDCVRVGATKVRVEADGYLGATISVVIKKGATSPVEALLVPESVLAGEVVDEKGAPVPGARVRVEVPARDAMMGMVVKMMGTGTYRSAEADSKGAFEVHGLAEGERGVKVEAAKFLTLEDKVSIPAQSRATKKFTLKPGFKISGAVDGPDGKPFAGAKIYATGKAPDGPGGMAAIMGLAKSGDAVATSDADGKWTADGLPPGPYAVRASADGYLDGETDDVAAGRTDVALKLGAAATIKGRVVALADGKPIVGATVERANPDGEKPAMPNFRRGRAMNFRALLGNAGSATTGADGTFEMKGLEPGTYELSATAKTFATGEKATVSCAAGQTFDGVELKLPPGVSLAGRVVEKGTGAAVAGAVVWAGGGGNPFMPFAASDFSGGDPTAPKDSISARTDADGKFVLAGLQPGEVTIEARLFDHAPTSTSATAPATDVVVEIGVGGAVEGHVVDSDGRAVLGAQITLGGGMMGGAFGGGSAKTDSSGDYRIDHLKPGRYQIKLVDNSNMMSMFMPGNDSVQVKEGQTVRHDFKTKAGANKNFDGVATRDGKPLAGAAVLLVGGNAGFKMASTDDDGRFRFDGLDPGDYTVLLQSSFIGGGSASKKVTVDSSGKVEDVRLELSSAKVEGDVLDADTNKGVAGAQVALMTAGAKTGSMKDVLGGYAGQQITDENGHFVISDVQNGTFSLRVSASDYTPFTLDGVAAGTRNVQAHLKRGFTFAVTVVDADGPVAGATVTSVDSASHESSVIDMAGPHQTGSDGIATLRLTSGRYQIRVVSKDHLPATVAADADSGGVTVTLARGASLDFFVRNSDGTVAPHARVVLKDSATGTTVESPLTVDSFMGGGDGTGEDGHYVRAGLSPGGYDVFVGPAGNEVKVSTTLAANDKRTLPDVVLK